jgi:hypothetical protein
MPKIACRLFLEITEVRVQRLKDISAEDALAEGIEKSKPLAMGFMNYSNPAKYFEEGNFYDGLSAASWSFLSLFASINGEEKVNENPFVWAITFKRIDKPANWPC